VQPRCVADRSRGRALDEAHAERRAVTAEILKASKAHRLSEGPPPALAERFDRVQEDLRALGLGRCIIALPHRLITG
jgi:hypothetical protein